MQDLKDLSFGVLHTILAVIQVALNVTDLRVVFTLYCDLQFVSYVTPTVAKFLRPPYTKKLMLSNINVS